MSNNFIKFRDIASHDIQSVLDRATEMKAGICLLYTSQSPRDRG